MSTTLTSALTLLEEVEELVIAKKSHAFESVRLRAFESDGTKLAAIITIVASRKQFEVVVNTSPFASDLAESIYIAYTQMRFEERFNKLMKAEYDEDILSTVSISFDIDYAVFDITHNGLRSSYVHTDINTTRMNVLNCIDKVKVIYDVLGSTSVL